MAIFGWQHLITRSNWTASIYAQLNQAAVVKARFPDLPVFVYTGFGNADGYNAETWAVMQGAFEGCPANQPCRTVPEPHADWFLEDTAVPVYSMSGCEQMGMGYSHPPTPRCANLLWNLANDSMRDYFVEKLVAPLAAAPFIDGVFFDCFNYAYALPDPWGRRTVNIPNCTNSGGAGCRALINGTLDLAARVARALNAAGKVPIYSNPATFVNGPTPAPHWLNESELVAALTGTVWMTNYEFMRAETLASSGQLANMLQEGASGVAAGVHTYYTNATEDPTPHVAAFQLVREDHWYFFGSTGWFDDSWQWTPLYDTVARCGRALSPAIEGPPGAWSRPFEGCRVLLNCTVPTACVADLVWPADLPAARRGAAPPVG